jgi:hypothetical protein
LFLSREKVRKNKIFKNNELKTDPFFRETSPSDSVHGFAFNSTILSLQTNSESQRYDYPVCHTLAATQHPLSRTERLWGQACNIAIHETAMVSIASLRCCVIGRKKDQGQG